MAVETSTFGAITRFISSFAKSLWHTWNRKWIVSITIFKYLIKYLWWCSIYQKMKRFAAILDASLNDNEGEQRGLVAFPHRVLQPDNNMVYIYIYNNKSSAAWKGGEIRNFFQSFNNYWQLSIVNIMESLPSLYSSNRLCWTVLIGIDDVTDLMMSRWFLLVGHWKISTTMKTMVTFNTSIFMAQSSIRRPSSVAALIWNSNIIIIVAPSPTSPSPSPLTPPLPQQQWWEDLQPSSRQPPRPGSKDFEDDENYDDGDGDDNENHAKILS